MRIVTFTKEFMPDLLRLTKDQVQETLPHMPYEEDVVIHNANFIAENPQGYNRIFLAYNEDDIAVGYLVAYVSPYLFNREVCVGQEVVYVHPDHRGSRAFLLLMKRLDKLAEDSKAIECYGGVANGRKIEVMLRWFKKHKYEKVGFYVRKIYKRSERP